MVSLRRQPREILKRLSSSSAWTQQNGWIETSIIRSLERFHGSTKHLLHRVP